MTRPATSRGWLVLALACALSLGAGCDKDAPSPPAASNQPPTTQPPSTPQPTSAPPPATTAPPTSAPPPATTPPTAPPPLPPPSAVTKSFGAVPKTMAEFQALRDAEAKTPEGGALVYVAALLAQAEGVAEADAMIVLTQHSSTLINGAIGPSMASRYKDARTQPQIARSYIVGTKPEDGYALPAELKVDMRPDGSGSVDPSGSVKLFVFSTGAASPRPIRLKLDTGGYWQVLESSSLLSGVRKP